MAAARLEVEAMEGGKHVLVTGGAGFIGSHTVEALVARGDRVTVLDDLSTGRRENLAAVEGAAGFTFIEGDATEPIALASAPTHIVHLAAQVSVTASLADPLTDLEKNLVATLRVLALAKATRARVVFASSAAIYGDGPLPSDEGLVPRPASPYGIHKLASEHHLRAAVMNDGGLSAAALRFFNVYGPRQSPSSPYAGVISIFLARALAGEPLTLFGGGAATRDFVYVGDVARAILAAVDAPALGGEALNVGGGGATSVRALAEAIIAITGSTSELREAPARAGEVLHSRAAVGLIAERLGWRAEVPLARGLEATAAWVAGAGARGA